MSGPRGAGFGLKKRSAVLRSLSLLRSRSLAAPSSSSKTGGGWLWFFALVSLFSGLCFFFEGGGVVVFFSVGGFVVDDRFLSSSSPLLSLRRSSTTWSAARYFSLRAEKASMCLSWTSWSPLMDVVAEMVWTYSTRKVGELRASAAARKASYLSLVDGPARSGCHFRDRWRYCVRIAWAAARCFSTASSRARAASFVADSAAFTARSSSAATASRTARAALDAS
mmetsp:Transcript_19781/g.63626  ORF Transcript_19781/g.63626 Transcript_19781/m.63626 type:complete len:224 (+) Transcript_19781:2471-3142(+)